MNTLTHRTSERYDPQAYGFTFPNSWKLEDAVSQEVRGRWEAAVDDVFTFLSPIPSIELLKDPVNQTVRGWVSDVSDFIQPYGLCGGMAFAALDYFKASCPITDHSRESGQIPPELRRYIVKRMIDSLVGPNVARVLAWMVVEHQVPFGGGRRLLLHWTRAECDKLKDLIAKNGGWPIALIGESIDPSHNHQVLAYRCEPGKDQCEVYIYDVNYPGAGRRLSLDLHGSMLELGDDSISDAWKPLRGLFCEEYFPAEPWLPNNPVKSVQPVS